MLFAFTAQAVAGTGVGYPPGQRHALLIFAMARTREAAEATAVAGVAAEGWVGVDLLRGKAVEVDVGAVADDTIRAAAQAALAEGCGFVVYSDPIPHDG